MPVGGVAEWSNAPVLKTDGRESVPRVRIPVPPPFCDIDLTFLLYCNNIRIATPYEVYQRAYFEVYEAV